MMILAMIILIVHRSVTLFETKRALPVRPRLILLAFLVIIGVIYPSTVVQAQNQPAQDEQTCSKGTAACDVVAPQDAGAEGTGAEAMTSELTAPPPGVEAQLSTGDRERARAEWAG